MDKVKLNVLGLSYNHSNSGAYALVLAEEDGKRRIPIIIGAVEAQAIAIQLEGLTPPRPLTHDLFFSFAEAFRIHVEEVIIYKLKDGIFFSELICDNGSNRIRIDSRTSDAVALALRFKVPIYTSTEIIDAAGIILDDEGTKSKYESTENLSDTPADKPGILKENELKDFDMDELNELLQDAIENEDYEQASIIRDELSKRQQQ